MTEPLRPDAISAQRATGWDAVAPVVREAALTLPNVAKLIYRILRDDRVPQGTKVFAAGMFVYLVSPIDLLPEALLGPLGKVDDLRPRRKIRVPRRAVFLCEGGCYLYALSNMGLRVSSMDNLGEPVATIEFEDPRGRPRH